MPSLSGSTKPSTAFAAIAASMALPPALQNLRACLRRQCLAGRDDSKLGNHHGARLRSASLFLAPPFLASPFSCGAEVGAVGCWAVRETAIRASNADCGSEMNSHETSLGTGNRRMFLNGRRTGERWERGLALDDRARTDRTLCPMGNTILGFQALSITQFRESVRHSASIGACIQG